MVRWGSLASSACRGAIVVAGLATAAPAFAGETISYRYDALGRLVEVTHTGTINKTLRSSYVYDPAGNRQNATVTGSDAKVMVVPVRGVSLLLIGN